MVDDVSPRSAFETLASDGRSVLVDVRTRAEWAFVGLPDLSGLGKRVVTVEWQTFPDNGVDPAFPERLAAALTEIGADTQTELFFICRSGGRSRMAAELMTATGFTRCHNVAEGFEGPLDAERHRGKIGGWKAAGLPWAQG
ncbi:MAG: rhodanese-like domain-containing protein [Hyphomicrobiaceae bacterium]|nr:rhodanese-like domain-containing protein [Hyphomicrobiaceae bacterium]